MNLLKRMGKKDAAAAAEEKPDNANNSTVKMPAAQGSANKRTSAASAASPTTTASSDNFEARRSARVSGQQFITQADGDVWQETLAVCEQQVPGQKEDGKLVIRSYYTNQRTSQRIWDEPPSGASTILQATEDMRRMANLQLEEMQISTGGGVFPDFSAIAAAAAADDDDDAHEAAEKPRRRIFGFRPKKDKSNKPTAPRRIQYKPGSSLLSIKKKTKQHHADRDETMDPDMQKAIALSMGGATTTTSASTVGIDHDSSQQQQQPRILSTVEWQGDMDEEMAMAKALSISEAETLHETQDMRRALELSVGTAGGGTTTSNTAATATAMVSPVARGGSGGEAKYEETDQVADLLGFGMDDDAVVANTKTAPHLLDQKMPAKKNPPPKVAAAVATSGGAAASTEDLLDQKLPAKKPTPTAATTTNAATTNQDLLDQKPAAKKPPPLANDTTTPGMKAGAVDFALLESPTIITRKAPSHNIIVPPTPPTTPAMSKQQQHPNNNNKKDIKKTWPPRTPSPKHQRKTSSTEYSPVQEYMMTEEQQDHSLQKLSPVARKSPLMGGALGRRLENQKKKQEDAGVV